MYIHLGDPHVRVSSPRKISVLSNSSSCGHDEGVQVQCFPLSLLSLLHLPPPPKKPLYNQSTMTQADYHDLLQPQVVCFACADLLLGYLRLCLVSVHLHKGVVNKVKYYSKAVLFALEYQYTCMCIAIIAYFQHLGRILTSSTSLLIL